MIEFIELTVTKHTHTHKIHTSVYGNIKMSYDHMFVFYTTSRDITIYYTNTPMQYTAIFHGCKNLNFQIKK